MAAPAWFVVCAGVAALASTASAQVEHKKEWLPVREVQMTAPPPTRATERLDAFKQRNNAEAVRQIAEQLFGLIDPAYAPEDEAQRQLYDEAWDCFRAGRFPEALEAYKTFSFARLRTPPQGVKPEARDPAARTFIEFYNRPDELMRGIFRFQMFDKRMPQSVIDIGLDSIINYYRAGKHNDHMLDIVLQNGQPGAMNWVFWPQDYFAGTWHLPDDASFASLAYRQDMCFTPLLVAYLEKNDKSYLNQWVGYVDDHLLNYRRDLREAGLLLKVSAAGAGGPSLAHVNFVVLNAPEIDRDFPATTYARLILRRWTEDLPLIVLGARATGANRAMHMYGELLTQAQREFPELIYATTLLTERRRILESYARQYMMADGSSIDYAPNYNKNFIIWPSQDIDYLRAMKSPPAWFTEEWIRQMREEQLLMARYLIRSFAPDGSYPGYKDPLRKLLESTVGKGSYFAKFLPEALADPDNAAVIAKLLHRPGAPDPGFASDAYPYGGYFFMRENWDPDARFLYFHDYRPGESGSWRHHKNIHIQAFGQRMLSTFRWESPLLVDGAGHINSAIQDLYPEDYAGPGPRFGSHGYQSAWQEPLPNRWHTSSRFDLAEGKLKIPFAEKFRDGTSTFIDDVAHGRQVMFLRGAGGWIVTDRVRAESPHRYHLLWSFDPDELNPEEWRETDWRTRGKKPPPKRDFAYAKNQIIADPAAAAIRTAHPTRPNLSIYHAASLPITLEPGRVLQNDDVMFGSSYRAGPEFRADREAVVASLLYPRRVAAADISSFAAVHLEQGTGFDAVAPSGDTIRYRGVLAAAALSAGDIDATATVLLAVTDSVGTVSGIVLDGTRFVVAGKAVTLPHADAEYAVGTDGHVSFTPIHRPLPRVQIAPEADVFVDGVDVTLTHPEPGVEIRYTLDGTEPGPESAAYTTPIHLTESTRVRAKAFRPGVRTSPMTHASTEASVDMSARYRKVPYRPAIPMDDAMVEPGLMQKYFEGDWTLSMLTVPIVKPLVTGVATRWFDRSFLRANENPYAFVYEGLIRVPTSGVYTFHGPFEFFDVGERAGYDLMLEVDGEQWYPATRTHNFGNWSVPLAAGFHAVKLSYVDSRRRESWVAFDRKLTAVDPNILISGPGLEEPQPVPNEWLLHQKP
jgi:hypothetical protein